MKKNVTYIDAQKFQIVLEKHGCKMVPQAGFIKVSGAEGRNLYVSKQKRVGRVDFSGWTIEGEGYLNLGGEKFGNVEQQLDFSLPEAEVLANFEKALLHMLSLPPAEKKKRQAPMTSKKEAAKGWTEHVPAPKTEDDKAARLARIKAYSEKTGKPISDKTLAALQPTADKE